MEQELSLKGLDVNLFAEPQGGWEYLWFVGYEDLIVTNPETGGGACRIENRSGVLKVWWNNGPQYYVLSYAHTVTSAGAETDRIFLKLRWMNQGGGVEKTETISDYVSCRDTKRHTVWTFGLSAEQAEFIKKTNAELFGPVIWRECR